MRLSSGVTIRGIFPIAQKIVLHCLNQLREAITVLLASS